METIIFATKNKGKIKEINEILADMDVNVISMEEAGITIDVVEDGKTFEENAMKKAVQVMEIGGKITLSDDSGLEIDYMDKAPGIYSARFSGEDANDEKNNQKLLELVRDQANRAARFVCALVLANGGREKLYVEEYAEGRIIDEPRGENGFGYDPLFYVEEYGQTFAQIPSEVKNKISHRAKALDKLKKEVEKL